MKIIKTTLFAAGLMMFAACGQPEEQAENLEKNNQEQTVKKEETMDEKKYVYELAINKAKDWETFTETREKFVEVLGKEDATLNEGKWKPFFTFGEMDLSPVLIGMTHWKSMEGFGEAGMRLMPQEEAKNYFASFDPLAYGVLETVDGKPFDMESIKEDGLVVEIAVRKGKTEDAFGEKRDVFFNSLNKYDGFKFSREFKYYEMNEQGMPVLQDNTQAVIIVWENAEKFQAAVPSIMESKESADFMPNVEPSVYFAANPLK